MNTKSIEQRVAQVIADCTAVDLASVTPDATMDSLGLDSLDEVEVLMGLEDEFNIAIPDDVRFPNVGALVETVKTLTGVVA